MTFIVAVPILSYSQFAVAAPVLEGISLATNSILGTTNMALGSLEKMEKAAQAVKKVTTAMQYAITIKDVASQTYQVVLTSNNIINLGKKINSKGKTMKLTPKQKKNYTDMVNTCNSYARASITSMNTVIDLYLHLASLKKQEFGNANFENIFKEVKSEISKANNDLYSVHSSLNAIYNSMVQDEYDNYINNSSPNYNAIR
ncbi:MAG: hypothetical protein QM528_02875 [Phycisphaerales bacterium]|nr:hypothetical protein [Phycisphaerales bacterium]